jgi:hypothetical protein
MPAPLHLLLEEQYLSSKIPAIQKVAFSRPTRLAFFQFDRTDTKKGPQPKPTSPTLVAKQKMRRKMSLHLLPPASQMTWNKMIG